MNKRAHIQDELNQIAGHQLRIPDQNPYSVPDDYFEKNHEQIIARIHMEDALHIDVREEIEHISPMLAAIRHKETYRAEKNYFEKNNARIIQIDRRVYFKKIAVAASLFLFISGAATFFLLRNNDRQNIVKESQLIKTDQEFNAQLAQIEPEDLLAYLENYSLPSDRSIMENNIDSSELPEDEEYFDENTINEWLLDSHIN
jgi:hypothetical protein